MPGGGFAASKVSGKLVKVQLPCAGQYWAAADKDRLTCPPLVGP